MGVGACSKQSAPVVPPGSQSDFFAQALPARGGAGSVSPASSPAVSPPSPSRTLASESDARSESPRVSAPLPPESISESDGASPTGSPVQPDDADEASATN